MIIIPSEVGWSCCSEPTQLDQRIQLGNQVAWHLATKLSFPQSIHRR